MASEDEVMRMMVRLEITKEDCDRVQGHRLVRGMMVSFWFCVVDKTLLSYYVDTLHSSLRHRHDFHCAG